MGRWGPANQGERQMKDWHHLPPEGVGGRSGKPGQVFHFLVGNTNWSRILDLAIMIAYNSLLMGRKDVLMPKVLVQDSRDLESNISSTTDYLVWPWAYCLILYRPWSPPSAKQGILPCFSLTLSIKIVLFSTATAFRSACASRGKKGPWCPLEPIGDTREQRNINPCKIPECYAEMLLCLGHQSWRSNNPTVGGKKNVDHGQQSC